MQKEMTKKDWARYHRIKWGLFDKTNSQHRLILSLCRQAGWTTCNPKYGEVADLARLQGFLKSAKSPVKKPLKQQTPEELSKTIKALEGVVEYRYSNHKVKCPECLQKVNQAELDMFGGLCEACYELGLD